MTHITQRPTSRETYNQNFADLIEYYLTDKTNAAHIQTGVRLRVEDLLAPARVVATGDALHLISDGINPALTGSFIILPQTGDPAAFAGTATPAIAPQQVGAVDVRFAFTAHTRQFAGVEATYFKCDWVATLGSPIANRIAAVAYRVGQELHTERFRKHHARDESYTLIED